jgi:hypothetical protein
METRDTPQGIVGFKFAQALVMGEYDKAHEMLNEELKIQYPAVSLKKHFESMTSYAQPGEVLDVMVMNNSEIGAGTGDAEGWAYIPISGNCWSEAIAITAKPFGAEYLITDLMWGRP